ncbi:hypothetical protein ACU21_03965 [Actinobaculum suis]|nr:hypothetical protein ACU19_06060 [Actinobaculum suis]OCA94869.1 hypothetical protein ACU20_05745 [Actinobaculum suis]OCA95457.1 hypothetical protein ACU21_03965 [Actinobaculum suis]
MNRFITQFLSELALSELSHSPGARPVQFLILAIPTLAGPAARAATPSRNVKNRALPGFA